MSQDRVENRPSLPEHQIGRWIRISDFGFVQETQVKYSRMKLKQIDYPFRIPNKGDFTFRLTEAWRESVNNDRYYTNPVVVHSPLFRINGIEGRIESYERRFESILFSPAVSWDRLASGEFSPSQPRDVSFRVQIRMPEGTIYSAEEIDTTDSIDPPYIFSGQEWLKEDSNSEVMPLIPKEATDYIGLLQFRVVEASSTESRK